MKRAIDALRAARALGIVLAASGANAVLAAELSGDENPACEAQSSGGDFVSFTCPLRAGSGEQRWRFQADFAGGHDDTSASMTLTLDDAPLVCGPGSKTRLFGEDGNVSLVCRFRAGTAATAEPVLRVALVWSHAQYVRTELKTDPAPP